MLSSTPHRCSVWQCRSPKETHHLLQHGDRPVAVSRPVHVLSCVVARASEEPDWPNTNGTCESTGGKMLSESAGEQRAAISNK